jgi:hypothetical protein
MNHEGHKEHEGKKAEAAKTMKAQRATPVVDSKCFFFSSSLRALRGLCGSTSWGFA